SIQPHQFLSYSDFLADFNQNIPDDSGNFAANASLIGGYEGSRQVHGALDGHFLDRRRFRIDDSASPGTAPTAAALAGFVAFLAFLAFVGTPLLTAAQEAERE